MLSRLTSPQWIARCALAGLVAVAVVLCFVEPGATSWLPQCPFHALTGLYCPGCGSTRMLYFLIHGHPLLAFRENALATIMLPAVLYSLVRQAAGRKAISTSKFSPGSGIAFAAIVLLFTIARNIPIEPFEKLAPQPINSVATRIESVLTRPSL